MTKKEEKNIFYTMSSLESEDRRNESPNGSSCNIITTGQSYLSWQKKRRMIWNKIFKMNDDNNLLLLDKTTKSQSMPSSKTLQLLRSTTTPTTTTTTTTTTCLLCRRKRSQLIGKKQEFLHLNECYDTERNCFIRNSSSRSSNSCYPSNHRSSSVAFNEDVQRNKNTFSPVSSQYRSSNKSICYCQHQPKALDSTSPSSIMKAKSKILQRLTSSESKRPSNPLISCYRLAAKMDEEKFYRFSSFNWRRVCVLWPKFSFTLATIQFLLISIQTLLLSKQKHQQQQQHQNKYHFSTRLKDRTTITFLPILPVICSYLIIWFLLISMLPSTNVSAAEDVKLRSNETVCKSVEIRNSPNEYRGMTDCTVIEGFLLMTLIDRVNHSDFKLTFPKLTEVTEYVLIYRVNGLRTLGDMFPNLTVIRGKSLFEGFALVIYQNTHLEEVGLKSLRTIAKGAVRIEKNPALCFVHTVDWKQISITSDMDFIADNKPTKECPQCPGSTELFRSDDVSGGGSEFSCPLVKGERHCWNSRHCQKICPQWCKDNCDDESKCCNPACLGGCATDNPNRCTVCRALVTLGTCMNECPKNFFTYLGRSCVTSGTCLNSLKTKFEIVGPETLVPFDGVCSTRCPEGYFKTDSGCEKCKGSCIKTCEGGLIDSVGAAKQLQGCTHIVNQPLVISIKRGGRHLMEDLGFGLSSIVEIDTYLKVHRTFGLVSLSFFKNLERIKGRTLESGRYVLYVLENHDLETIWGPNQIVKMDEGRVFFHFNPKLCYSEIDKLRTSLKNSSQFDKSEVATDSNGSKGSCNTEILNVTVVSVSSVLAHVRIQNPMRYADDRGFIGYQYFYMEDPYGNASLYSSYRICDDGWTSSDPVKEVDFLFQHLKPYTQYAFYVKTQTISSEPRNGQSPMQHFKTKPDQPKLVQNLRSFAKSPSEISVQWLPPTVVNGRLEKYIIRALIDTNDPEQLKTRNFCKNPVKDSVNLDVPSGVIPAKKENGRQTANDDWNCDGPRKSSKQPQVEEAVFENIIDFENNLQNFIYVKNSNASHYHNTSNGKSGSFKVKLTSTMSPMATMTSFLTTPTTTNRRRRRDMISPGNNYSAVAHNNNNNNEKAFDEIGNNPTSDIIRKSRLSKNKLYFEYSYNEANASMNEFIITGLKHFSLYTIYVRACRAIEENATTNECSPDSITYARTKKRDDVDKIRNLQATLEKTNTTRNVIRLKWDPPEDPNSITVSYIISYISDAQDAVAERKCITTGDYQNLTNGYVLTDLTTGNYTIRVRANSLAGEGLDSDPVYKFVPPTQLSNEMLIAIIAVIVIIVMSCAGGAFYCRKKLLSTPSDLKMFPTVNPYYISLHYVPDEWEVPRDKVIQLGALGQGSFGMVYEGILKNFNGNDDTPCAIKTVNENATDRERMNFLNEASVMKQFDTYHVVRLLGVCSQGQPALVIMELMKNGDLKSFLRLHRADGREEHVELYRHDELIQLPPPPLSRILQMAIEIADGMAYLAAKKYVHRDLAARNCMVAVDLTVKIGDFGMTRDVYETDYYRKGTKGLLPVRWMPPESLKDGVYSSASDVFSYGVVLWEMTTLASQPYPGYSNDQVLRYVIDGGVMERPENCPDKLYKLMQKCWHHRPTARPTFMEIIRYLLDTADPHFRDVSFYHSEEATALRNQIQTENLQNSCDLFSETEHDLDDVTTPLRVGEYNYRLNIENNSSIGQHESPMVVDDDQQPTHSPYSLGSAVLISSTPDGHFKNSLIFSSSMYKNNPTLSLPSTSGAVKYGDGESLYNFPLHHSRDLYVQHDPAIIYSDSNRDKNRSIKEVDDLNNGYEIHDPIKYSSETEQNLSSDDVTSVNAAREILTAAKVQLSEAQQKSYPSQHRSITTQAVVTSSTNNFMPTGGSSLGIKRAVAEKVQNVSNSLVPLRIRNMDFLRNRRIFNQKRNGSNATGKGDSGSVGITSSNLSNQSNSNSYLDRTTGSAPTSGYVDCSGIAGSTSVARSIIANLTPSHVSDNPNYQILNESLSTSALAHDVDNDKGKNYGRDSKCESITIVDRVDECGDDDSPNPPESEDENEDENAESIERMPLSRKRNKSISRKNKNNKNNRNRQISRSGSNTSSSPRTPVTTLGLHRSSPAAKNAITEEQCNLNKENSSCSYIREKTLLHHSVAVPNVTTTTTTITATASTLRPSPFNSVSQNVIEDDVSSIKSWQQLQTTIAATLPTPAMTASPKRSAYHHLKETWLKQQPPNGFIGGREG